MAIGQAAANERQKDAKTQKGGGRSEHSIQMADALTSTPPETQKHNKDLTNNGTLLWYLYNTCLAAD